MECSYCGTELERTEGKMRVLNNGTKLYYCSAKCEKHHDRGRNMEYAGAE